MKVKADFNLAKEYYRKGDLPKALFYLKQAYRAEPRNKDILLAMADCHLRLGNNHAAIKVIRHILKKDPRNDKLCFSLCLAYSRIGNIERTIEAGERAIKINRHELNYYVQLADIYEKINKHEEALKIIEQGLKRFPDNGLLQISAAKSERRLDKCEESLDRLKKMSGQEAKLPPVWRARYHFELGFIYDGNNNPDLAFHHFTQANKMVRSLPSFRRAATNHYLDHLRKLGKLDFSRLNEIIEFSKSKPPRVQPVFFMGFPRSGTTLLQKVLDSHSDVHVIEEHEPLADIALLVEREPEKYLQSSFLLDEKNIESLRNMYFAEARKHVPVDDGSLVIDKLPLSIVQLPIIKILFPDARILLGLRHPCDSILSCFMQYFRINRAMANMFEFSSIIDYYDQVMGLWAIYKNNIDCESYSVRYEDLVENLEGEVRGVLQFLGLPWQEGVLTYRQNVFKRGLINTPSYSQVVKPIYKESRNRWHRYAKYFEPHLEKLRPHAEAFAYSLEVHDHAAAGND
jgi:tetratricopeptide (TPR) repeat protein